MKITFMKNLAQQSTKFNPELESLQQNTTRYVFWSMGKRLEHIRGDAQKLLIIKTGKTQKKEQM